MRQNTTNTFDQGMNKDLNPIVTPNNVLTDCLNGTFITFNGDELSLQNDSGNTKIPVPNEPGKFVELSPGFRPIGMKEYGGVLYIASGKKAPLDENNQVYGEDLIEFGSYPSPENMSPEERKGGIPIKVDSLESLYKAKVINNSYFKTGGYVTFQPYSEASPAADNGLLWTPDSPGNLYIIKLLHQLDNGVFDLTSSIWEDYKAYKKVGKASHWLNEVDFKYYCPNRYKGKLAIETILNEPQYFNFKRYPEINSQKVDFEIQFFMTWDNSGPLKINKYNIALDYGDGLPITTQIEEPYPVGAKGSFYEPILTISKEKKIVSYIVTPVLTYNDLDYAWDAFPQEFKDKFTLKGTILLEDLYLDLLLIESRGQCIGSTGTRRIEALSLAVQLKSIGSDLKVIKDEELGQEGKKPLIFVWKDSTLPIAGLKKVGSYTIDATTKKPIFDLLDTDYLALYNTLDIDQKNIMDTFIYQLTNTDVIVDDSTCFEQFVTFNFGYNPFKLPRFRWQGDNFDSIGQLDGTHNNTNVYKVLYKPGKSLTATVDFDSMYIASSTIKTSELNIRDLSKAPRIITSNASINYASEPRPLTALGTQNGQFIFDYIYFDGYTEYATLDIYFTVGTLGTPLTYISMPQISAIVSRYFDWTVNRTYLINESGNNYKLTLELFARTSERPKEMDSGIPNQSYPKDSTLGMVQPLRGSTFFTMNTSGGTLECSFSVASLSQN